MRVLMRFDTRQPCESCPYRRDARLGFWHPDHFLDLLNNDADPLHGAIYGCHQTRKLPVVSVCAGWLLDQRRRGVPSIMLRLRLIRDPEARACVEEVNAGGHKLYRTLQSMCAANLRAGRRKRRART